MYRFNLNKQIVEVPEGFYVYVLSNPEKIPFYVGKGHGGRVKVLGNLDSRKVARSICAEDKLIAFTIIPTQTDDEAYELEIMLIAKYGRLDLGTGTFCNHNGGGEGGNPGSYTAASRQKISDANKGNYYHSGDTHTEEAKAKIRARRALQSAPMLGKKHTEMTKFLISSTLSGSKLSDITRQRMSVSQKLRRSKEKENSHGANDGQDN